MRHVLVLNRLPHNMAPYEKWFNGHDITWTMLGWQDIADSYDDHTNKIFYKNYANDRIVKDVYDLCKKQRPSALVTTSEFDVVRMAQIREAFNIPGQSVTNAILFRDKIEMKKKVAQAGLKVPEFIRAKSALDIVQFIDIHGYPIIVKPVDGAGTVNVNLIHDDEELNAFFEKSTVVDLDVETYIDGKLYHIDGLIYEGEVKFIWPHAYNSDSTLGFASGHHMGSYMLDSNDPISSRLIAFTKGVLTALETPELATFHCEVFHSVNNELVLCEIACRLGGGRIVPALNAAFGVDLYEYWVKAQVGIPLNIQAQTEPKQMAGHLLYLPKGGIYRGPESFDQLDWVDELLINVTPGQLYGANSSVDFAGSAVVTGKTELEVRSKLAEVVSEFDRQMVWEDA
jgi:phosphoribosylaminoimidazole carboxylase (NCAIR synthetase)